MSDVNQKVYTSEQKNKSYSGVNVYEFANNGVEFWLNKGIGAMHVRAYNVHVRYMTLDLFTITTYEGDKLFDVLERRVDSEIAAMVFSTAFSHMSATKFISRIVDDAHSKGYAAGKQEAQWKMRDALGLED